MFLVKVPLKLEYLFNFTHYSIFILFSNSQLNSTQSIPLHSGSIWSYIIGNLDCTIYQSDIILLSQLISPNNHISEATWPQQRQ